MNRKPPDSLRSVLARTSVALKLKGVLVCQQNPPFIVCWAMNLSARLVSTPGARLRAARASGPHSPMRRTRYPRGPTNSGRRSYLKSFLRGLTAPPGELVPDGFLQRQLIGGIRRRWDGEFDLG